MMFNRQLCYCEIPSDAKCSLGIFALLFESTHVVAVNQEKMSVNSHTLEIFLKSVEKRAYRMAYIATTNVDDALDIVQEAMLVLATKYANRDEKEWPPLFFRIVQNKIKDFYRRQKVRNIFQAWFSSKDEVNDEDPIQNIADEKVHDPIRKISAENKILELEKVLQTLPNRQQQTFLLRAWEGLDVKQTAEAMNITTGSVKTHYSRALHALKLKLDYSEIENE